MQSGVYSLSLQRCTIIIMAVHVSVFARLKAVSRTVFGPSERDGISDSWGGPSRTQAVFVITRSELCSSSPRRSGVGQASHSSKTHFVVRHEFSCSNILTRAWVLKVWSNPLVSSGNIVGETLWFCCSDIYHQVFFRVSVRGERLSQNGNNESLYLHDLKMLFRIIIVCVKINND